MEREEIKKVEIGGRKFTIYLLDPFTAWRDGLGLLKMVAPAVGTALDGDFEIPEDAEDALAGLLEGDGSISAVVSRLVSSIDEDRTVEILRHLSGKTHVNGAPLEPQFEAVFRGRVSELIQWATAAIQHNFSDFSDALRTARAAAKAKAKGAKSGEDKG